MTGPECVYFCHGIARRDPEGKMALPEARNTVRIFYVVTAGSLTGHL